MGDGGEKSEEREPGPWDAENGNRLGNNGNEDHIRRRASTKVKGDFNGGFNGGFRGGLKRGLKGDPKRGGSFIGGQSGIEKDPDESQNDLVLFTNRTMSSEKRQMRFQVCFHME